MEKKRNLPPASSQLVERPLKQHHQSEAEQEEMARAFEQWQAFHAFFGSSSIPFYCSGTPVLVASSISFRGGALKERQTNSMFDASCSPAFRSSMSSSTPAFDSSIFQTPLEAVSKEMELKAVEMKEMELKAAIRAFAATCTPKKYRMKKFSEEEDAEPYTLISIPATTEEDGVKTLKYQSCFAIAGADYCVIAADFTNISHLSGKSAMASCGFQDDMKALQEALYAENLKYELEHKKPMSCPEMHGLLSDFQKRHRNYVFIVLGGLDSEGKGRVFLRDGPGDVTIAPEKVSKIRTMAPILEYELPAKDVLARLSETEAVELAKDVFRSATNTGDKLEIVVLNAKGLTPYNVDLRKEKKKNNSAVVESSSV